MVNNTTGSMLTTVALTVWKWEWEGMGKAHMGIPWEWE